MMKKSSIVAVVLVGAVAGSLVWAAKPKDQPEAEQPAGAVEIKGKVVETFPSGGYTYVQVDTGSEKAWAAASSSEAKVGDAVSFSGQMPMENFESKSLKRNFEKIYFVDEIAVEGSKPKGQKGADALPPGHPQLEPKAGAAAEGALPSGHPPVKPKAGAAAAALDASKVEKAPGGSTVVDIFAGKDALAGKKVTVRGLVVRYNASILDRNWLRLRDASCKDGSPDLSVTTKAETEVGRIVTVSGVLATNKDFGSGYRYEVLVEDATIDGK
jgi:hypothetical protein